MEKNSHLVRNQPGLLYPPWKDPSSRSLSKERATINRQDRRIRGIQRRATETLRNNANVSNEMDFGPGIDTYEARKRPGQIFTGHEPYSGTVSPLLSSSRHVISRRGKSSRSTSDKRENQFIDVRSPSTPSQLPINVNEAFEKEVQNMRDNIQYQADLIAQPLPATFRPNELRKYRSFDCRKATPAACVHVPSVDFPFTLDFLDDFWKSNHNGMLPSDADVQDFVLERLNDLEDNRAQHAIDNGQPPPKPFDMTHDMYKKLYIPILDRLQFYGWKIRNDPEFCRSLKISTLKGYGSENSNGELNNAHKKICSNTIQCLQGWNQYNFDTLQDWLDFLYTHYRRSGGNPEDLTGKTNNQLLRYYCKLLNPNDFTIRPGHKPTQALKKSFCKRVANGVLAQKREFKYPSLNLHPRQYEQEIEKLFTKYMYTAPKLENGCNSVPDKLMKLSKHQKFIREYFTPSNPIKGILLNHAAGTGKTCAAVSVISSFLDTNVKWNIVWVTRPSLKSQLNKTLFHDVCLRSLRNAIKDDNVSINNHQTYIDKIRYVRNKQNWTAINRKYAKKFIASDTYGHVITYGQLANAFAYAGCNSTRCTELARRLFRDGPDPLKHTLLVFDEAHNIFNDKDLPIGEAKYMNAKVSGVFGKNIAGREHIVRAIHNSYLKSGDQSCKVLLATATPIIHTPIDVFRLLNIIIPKPENRLPETETQFKAYRTPQGYTFFDTKGNITQQAREDFKQKTLGLISYFDGNRDPRYFPMIQYHVVNVPITRIQEVYLRKCTGMTPAAIKNYNHNENKMWGSFKDYINNRILGRKKTLFGEYEKQRQQSRKKRKQQRNNTYNNVTYNPAYKKTRRKKPIINNNITNREQQQQRRRQQQQQHRKPNTTKSTNINTNINNNNPVYTDIDFGHGTGFYGEHTHANYKQKSTNERHNTTTTTQLDNPIQHNPGDIKPIPIPQNIPKRSKDRIITCMKNVANVAAIRGKLINENNVTKAGKMRQGKSFSFTFDGKVFTPDIMRQEIGAYAPKIQKMLNIIQDLDKRDKKAHGHFFKHAIYTDTQGAGYGSKVIAAAFIALGFQRACHFTKKRTNGSLITTLEPPLQGTIKCKGSVKPTNEDITNMHTLAILSSTSIDGHPKDNDKTNATINLYNNEDNKYGKHVRFIILDSGFKEGISLHDVRYMHIMEPPLSQSSFKQAVARSARWCKSTNLKVYSEPPRGWHLDVYVYRSVYPAYMGKQNPEEYGTKESPATIHQAIINSFETNAMQTIDKVNNLILESSVDFSLNKAMLTYKAPNIVQDFEYIIKTLNL